MERRVADATDVQVGRDLLSPESILGDLNPSSVGIIAQPGSQGIARGVMRSLGASGVEAAVRVIPDGESAKTLGVVEDVGLWLNERGLTRSDLIVAIGGGAATDLGGFVAATYLRGIDAVYVPTTLLCAVDAAIGGKSGVNLAGKNLIGAFRHPKRVVVDVDIISRTPVELIRSGAAEALKTGLIGDPELVAVLERDGLDADLGPVIERSINVKADIVEADFMEASIRLHLNYGHTIGHAVEVLMGISHGEAVAIGMVAAGRVSAELAGFADEQRQRELISALGLPTSAPGLDKTAARRLIGLDKKRDLQGLRMVLLAAIGEPEVVSVDAATVDAALDAITESP